MIMIRARGGGKEFMILSGKKRGLWKREEEEKERKETKKNKEE